MTTAIVLTSFSCLVFLVWSTRHLLISRQQGNHLLLSGDSPGPPGDAPMISVVVAAKDEAENIEACVRSLLGQDYPSFEIIVCNDRSSDETAHIVERIAAQDARVRLINIDSLPPGWYGKNHAVAKGVAAARGPWICMTDADCRQISTRTLSVAAQHALTTGADLLSVLPVLETRGFLEDVIQPVCGGVMMIWFNPEKVNNPDKPAAYANGAFILMKRSSYEAIGTHEAIKGMMMEDMHLARRIKQAGMNLRVVQSKGLYSVRMYASLKETIAGWSRIFFGAFITLGKLAASLATLVFMGLLPYAAAVVGLVLAASGGRTDLWLVCGIAGLAAAGMQLSVIYRFYKLVGARKNLAWTYPLGCIAASIAVVLAMAKLLPGAKLTWRGTTYEAGAGSSISDRAL
jgi:glycosyltransferase involved in cell wall biosynthesis